MVKTIVWNIKGQINSEFQIVSSEEEEAFWDEQLRSNPDVYGVKSLGGKVLPSQDKDGSLWLDNRRVG